MRGLDDRSEGFFSYVRLEERIPSDHPLRPIKALADQALVSLNKRFEGLYSSMGRPSIAPEMLGIHDRRSSGVVFPVAIRKPARRKWKAISLDRHNACWAWCKECM